MSKDRVRHSCWAPANCLCPSILGPGGPCDRDVTSIRIVDEVVGAEAVGARFLVVGDLAMRVKGGVVEGAVMTS